MSANRRFLERLRRLGLVEGVSTLLLFGVAMPLKHLAGQPLAVRISGWIHGVLFVALVLMLMLAVRRVPISRTMAGCGVLAAVIPFGPFVYDRYLQRLQADDLNTDPEEVPPATVEETVAGG